MAKNEDYQMVWNAYIHALIQQPSTCFSTFIKDQPVSLHGIRHWMERNNISIMETKDKVKGCLEEFRKGTGNLSDLLSERMVLEEPAQGKTLVPLQITGQPASQSSKRCLAGISITFPDGIQVSIRQGDPRAVMEFLKLYKSEEAICLG